MRRGPAIIVAAAVLLGGCGPSLEQDEPLVVAAASDLRPAFDELARGHPREVRFVYGSSGQLAAQLIEGAPYDLYASANVSFVDRVLEAGRGDPGTKATYAFGRIVIWTRTAPAPSALTDLADPRFESIAIANPAHAPYGMAADEALRAAGIHDALAGRLVFGENVADTLRLVATGNADAGIVALSLALAASEEGHWTLVSEDLHAPIEQTLVVTATEPAATERATAFLLTLRTPEGREIMRRYGFDLPDDRAPTDEGGR